MVNIYEELEDIEIKKGDVKNLQDDILDMYHDKSKQEKLVALMNELQELEKELEIIEQEFCKYL